MDVERAAQMGRWMDSEMDEYLALWTVESMAVTTVAYLVDKLAADLAARLAAEKVAQKVAKKDVLMVES